ncbi:heme ABC transporter ATP-binding protein [Kiritimatiellota bacterium B12222]|nr:heme ABC transporter ATP-binding protein [Kiritimatiellota bacterium B12222]
MMDLQQVSVIRNKRHILSEINFQLTPGQVSVVIGLNGAGKSSLVRLLSGAWKPSAGHILWNQQPLSLLNPATIAKFRAVVNQQSDLRFEFSVREVVEMGGYPHRSLSKATREKEVDQALTEVDLLSFANASATRLSGGEQKRMLLARALVQLHLSRKNGDGLLILDEPTAHLDIRHQEKLLETIRARAAEGLTVFAVLHDLNHATRVADQIILLQQGKLLAAGAVQDVMTPALLSQAFGTPLEQVHFQGRLPHWLPVNEIPSLSTRPHQPSTPKEPYEQLSFAKP